MIDAKLCLQIFVIVVVIVWILNKSGREIYKTYVKQKTRKGLLKLNWSGDSVISLLKRSKSY